VKSSNAFWARSTTTSIASNAVHKGQSRSQWATFLGGQLITLIGSSNAAYQDPNTYRLAMSSSSLTQTCNQVAVWTPNPHLHFPFLKPFASPQQGI
jgi:hypothetical protein